MLAQQRVAAGRPGQQQKSRSYVINAREHEGLDLVAIEQNIFDRSNTVTDRPVAFEITPLPDTTGEARLQALEASRARGHACPWEGATWEDVLAKRVNDRTMPKAPLRDFVSRGGEGLHGQDDLRRHFARNNTPSMGYATTGMPFAEYRERAHYELAGLGEDRPPERSYLASSPALERYMNDFKPSMVQRDFPISSFSATPAAYSARAAAVDGGNTIEFSPCKQQRDLPWRPEAPFSNFADGRLR